MLVQPIHDEIRATVAEEMKRYKKEMTSFNSLGREKAKAEEPEMPLNRMFIFSGNNTGTGILQNIIDSGGMGIICETEADMVSNSIASDYGHWSEVIRSSFDHDPLSYNRRTDREYRELRHSHLSVLISGTPGQVKPLTLPARTDCSPGKCSIICPVYFTGSTSSAYSGPTRRWNSRNWARTGSLT